MKTQADMTRPPTLDIAIRKYLTKIDAPVSYPKGTHAVGHYRLDIQYIMVYKENGKLVFDLEHLQHRSAPIEVSNTLGKLEKYLQRTEHLSYDEHITLKYTKYWD